MTGHTEPEMCSCSAQSPAVSPGWSSFPGAGRWVPAWRLRTVPDGPSRRGSGKPPRVHAVHPGRRASLPLRARPGDPRGAGPLRPDDISGPRPPLQCPAAPHASPESVLRAKRAILFWQTHTPRRPGNNIPSNCRARRPSGRRLSAVARWPPDGTRCPQAFPDPLGIFIAVFRLVLSYRPSSLSRFRPLSVEITDTHTPCLTVRGI